MATIKARPTIYKGVEMRSRLEATYAEVCDRHGWGWRYEPYALASAEGQWLPDFVHGTPPTRTRHGADHSQEDWLTPEKAELVGTTVDDAVGADAWFIDVKPPGDREALCTSIRRWHRIASDNCKSPTVAIARAYVNGGSDWVLAENFYIGLTPSGAAFCHANDHDIWWVEGDGMDHVDPLMGLLLEYWGNGR